MEKIFNSTIIACMWVVYAVSIFIMLITIDACHEDLTSSEYMFMFLTMGAASVLIWKGQSMLKKRNKELESESIKG